jgi:hypothetical protein
MKTFIYNQTKNNWLVTTPEGEAFVTELSPLQYYAMEVHDLHNILLEVVLKKYNYLSLGEVSLWLNDVNLGAEAQIVIDWYISTYKEVEAHLLTVTDYQDPTIFIATIDLI